jgi:lambda family phage minor tail protein L
VSISTDIQSLSPSAMVELFVLDLAKQGGPVEYFHAGTNSVLAPVTWQGNIYSPLPIEAEGFAVTAKGTLPRPIIRVANISGMFSQQVAQYNDLVGCKVTRKRTFAKYLDAVNFAGQRTTFAVAPVTGAIITAVDADSQILALGTGNGSVVTFSTPFGTPVALPMTVYKNDWQGNQFQYASARTNLFLRSEEFDSVSWSSQGVTITPNTDIAPDGIATTADTVAMVGAATDAVYQAGFSAGVYTMSVWVKVASGTLNFKMSSYSVTDGQVDSAFFTATTAWQKFSWTRTVTAASNFYPILNGEAIAKTFKIFGADIKSGATLSSYIPTAAAAVTVTDYALTAGVNPSADADQYLPDDIWYVDRKTMENRYQVEWELASAFDLMGVMLPRRQVIQNTCSWKYRTWNQATSSFDYTGASECGYTGAQYFDYNDAACTSAQDYCSKRLSSCLKRFPAPAAVPYGGFPGSVRY